MVGAIARLLVGLGRPVPRQPLGWLGGKSEDGRAPICHAHHKGPAMHGPIVLEWARLGLARARAA
eukprot:3165567-Alexandrium_andersonii.AAC.1